MRVRGSICVLALGLLSSCATTLYEGRDLTPAEGAVIAESPGTLIDQLDGKDVKEIRGRYAHYVVPPGPHLVDFGVKHIGFWAASTSDGARVCVDAEPGHRYVTETAYVGNSFRAAIVDSSAPVPNRVPISCDRDGVPTPYEIKKQWAAETIHLAHTRPVLDFTLALGVAFGGDNIVTAQLSDGSTRTLSAGSGANFGVGAMVTPLWLGDLLGLGVGGEISLKYNSLTASNASIGFTRYPAIATLNAFVRTGQKWFLLAAGGIDKDLGISLSGDGDASAISGSASSHLGGVGRLGMYFRTSDGVATTFGVGYTRLRYEGPGGSADASSFGFWLNTHWAVL